MPRHYSICEMTPSVFHRRTHSDFVRVYPQAPQGYLFHDSEKPIEFSDIHRPLFVLSELYTEGVKAVIGIQVDANTIVATFNTAGIPRPAKVGMVEHLSQHQYKGWVHPDIRDPASEAVVVNYDDIYDACTMLERFTGHCPCPKQAEGTCFSSTVFARFPWLAERLNNYSNPDAGQYKRVRYKDLYGFEYTSGQLSIKDNFTESVRPWDNYDFNLVPLRKKEFAFRGEEASRRSGHRTNECPKCAFSTKKHTGTYADCGEIRSCTKHATTEEAWRVLYDWLDKDTPYTRGNPQFALHEIHYLMHMSGTEALSRAITPTRFTQTRLAGFAGQGTLGYRLVPCQGNTQRRRIFRSYASIREEFPDLPDTKDIPEITLTRHEILAHAIFSTWHSIRGEGHQPHPVYDIVHTRGSVTLQGTTTRSIFSAYTLDKYSHVMDYYQHLWGRTYPQVHDKLQSPIRYPNVGSLDI